MKKKVEVKKADEDKKNVKLDNNTIEALETYQRNNGFISYDNAINNLLYFEKHLISKDKLKKEVNDILNQTPTIMKEIHETDEKEGIDGKNWFNRALKPIEPIEPIKPTFKQSPLEKKIEDEYYKKGDLIKRIEKEEKARETVDFVVIKDSGTESKHMYQTICNKCSYEFETNISHARLGGITCPSCNHKSKLVLFLGEDGFPYDGD